jgi:hypothetical protein
MTINSIRTAAGIDSEAETATRLEMTERDEKPVASLLHHGGRMTSNEAIDGPTLRDDL